MIYYIISSDIDLKAQFGGSILELPFTKFSAVHELPLQKQHKNR